MKLHLPKILRVAVLATFALPAMGAALSSSDITTPVAGGDSYLNVGMENTTDTWSGDMVVGDTAGTQGDVDKVGAFNDSWGFITPNGGKTNTSITSGLKISGSLTLQGSGKIVLGGQYKGASSYTGLEAVEAINVTGGSLTATKIITKNLTVSGGSVSTSTGNCTSGNGYAGGPKQSYIKESLTISGGSLAFGYTDNVQGIGGGGHRMTSLGSSSSFTMKQTGGTMRVYGDLDMKSGITINQSAGTMALRDTIYMGGSGTTTIDQSGDTSRLVLGRLESTGFLAGVCEFDIKQSGGGLIHLAYGSNFAKASTITLTQTGTGTINLGGGHDTGITGSLPSRGYALSGYETNNTTYTINQTSGKINIMSGTKIQADTADIGSTLTLAGGAELRSEVLQLSEKSAISNSGVLVAGTETPANAGADTIYVTKNGKLNLSGSYGSASDTDAIKKVAMSDGETNYRDNVTLDELAVSGGALKMTDGSDKLTVKTLNVASGGSIDLKVNDTTVATSAPLTIADGGSWSMDTNSSLNLTFTDDYLANIDSLADDTTPDVIDFNVEEMVATNYNATSLMNGFALKDMDERHWSFTDGKWTSDGTSSYVKGKLVFNPWIKVTEDGEVSESFSDVTSTLKAGLDISAKEVTLSGDNTHSEGTMINGAEVTLTHADALGLGLVTTSGTSSLIADVDGGAANLPGVITNSGTLTMTGAFASTGLQTETMEEGFFDIDGNCTSDGDGFKREGGTGYRVVTNGTGASLIVGENTTVTINGTAYQLYTNGMAGAFIDYTSYSMMGSTDMLLGDIIDASGNDLDTVEVSGGTLTVDEDVDITVNSTGGSVAVETGNVSGELMDTEVVASGGEISADIKGTSTLNIAKAAVASGNAEVTLSGDNDYSGATTIDGADVTLKNANALKGSPVTTKGESSLSTEGGAAAELAGSIQNEGSLTMSGTYTGSNFMTEASDSTRVCVDGVEGNNGFLREGTSVIVAVQNINGGTLTLDGSAIIKYNSEDYHLSTSGKAGKLDMGHYLIAEDAHSVRMSQIIGAGGSSDTTVEMQAGVLKADADVNDLQASSGTLEVTGTTTVDGAISGDTQVKLGDGATLAGKLSGGAKVEVTDGTATISGDNSHTGGTEIANGAKLKLGSADALGAGAVALRTGGILDLAGYAVSNYINVTGCTLCGADAYTGNVDVSGSLNLDGNATANKVTMVNGGTITPLANETLTVNTIEVVGADSTVGADLTVNPNGRIILNNGVILNLTGSLTLGNGATIVLHGQNYTTGSTLMTVNGDMNRTTGSVTLDYGFGTYARVGNEVRLMAIFDQNIADAMVQANWGIPTASRAFVHAVRGQRTNTGCIADGRGTAWAAVLGAYNDLDGGDINLKGAAVGADMKVGSRSSVGVAIGYLDGEVSPTGLSEVDQEGTYVALYGEHGLRKLSATSCLSADWVVAYGQTESKYKHMSWDQDSLQLNGRLSWNKQLSERLGLRVFGGLEYFTSDSDTVNGIKTGSIDNLRGELGVGVDYVAWGMPVDEKSAGMGCKRLVLHGELRYFNDLDRENPVVEMDGLSGRGENPGRSGVGIDVGATYRINDRWSTSANYSYSTMDGSTEHRLNVGASYTF